MLKHISSSVSHFFTVWLGIMCIGIMSVIPLTAHALDSYVSMRVSPAYPIAGEQVAVSIKSYGIDLSGASITWFVNGTEQSSAIGRQQLSLPAGQAGKTTTVRVVISGNTETIQKSISFVPGGIDLLWEAADSYTPPFYKGKALPSSSSLIKITALPHLVTTAGKAVSADSLIYTWNRNGFRRDLTTQSGYGKQTVSMTKDVLLHTESIGVDVASRDGVLGATGTITVPQVDPRIVFYEDRPLQGPWYATALTKEVTLLSNELSLIAEPYFFSTNNGIGNDLTFSWKVNGKTVSSDWINPRLVAFGVEKDTKGSASASLEVTSKRKLLQDARASLSILFGGQGSGTTIFP